MIQRVHIAWVYIVMTFDFSCMLKISPSFLKSTIMACALLGCIPMASASTATDELSRCLVKATTTEDKTAVLQWTFVALSTHPELKAFTNVSDAQKEQLDKNFAAVVQRILIEQCSTEAKAVIKADGVDGIGASFQELGKITGEEILSNPEIKAQLKGVLKYVDLNKLILTFLTPDLWNKLGSLRGK